jgi:uncharacterized membrane protein (DUF485 family)
MSDASRVEQVSRARSRVSLLLSAATLVVYFGFILSVAFAKEFMGSTITPGLSFGVLLGALVIVTSFALTGIYARWANRHDASVSALEQGRK